MFRTNSTPISANEVPALDGIPEHTHEFLEFAIVSRGSGVHVTRDGATPVEKGSLVLIRPGIWHAYHSPVELWTFNLYLAPELLQREMSWIVEYPDLARALLRGEPNLGRLSSSSTTRVIGWLQQIAEIAPGQHVPTLIGLTSSVIDAATEVMTVEGEGGSTNARWVVTMMTMMQSNLSAQWSIATLSRALNLSPTAVHRMFKRYTGMSPMSWLQQARGEAAATQLVLTDHPISEIGRAIGWGDPNYMSRRFRAQYGLSPSQYRARFTGSAVSRWQARHTTANFAIASTTPNRLADL